MKARFLIFAAILPLLLWACGGNGDTGKIRLIKTDTTEVDIN